MFLYYPLNLVDNQDRKIGREAGYIRTLVSIGNCAQGKKANGTSSISFM